MNGPRSLTLLVVAVGVIAGISVTASRAKLVAARAPLLQTLQPHPPEHRMPSVDGAVHPELIPDERALSMLLLMAADPDARAGRSYVHHIFNRAQHQYRPLTPAVIESIRVAAVAYTSELRTLYRSGQRNIEREMAALTAAYQARLIELLGPDGAMQLSDILTVRVKPKVRTFSRP